MRNCIFDDNLLIIEPQSLKSPTMRKLTLDRLITMTFCGLGFFAMLSLSSCDEAGEATNQQDTEKTEETTHMEEAHQGEHPSADSEHPHSAEADTTHHADDEHPAGNDEHPAGGDEHPN